jgi:2-haloacid dehalogenase
MEQKVIFDLGGVLLDWNPRYLYQCVFDDQAEMEYFLGEICSPEWNAQMDAGKPFSEAIEELALLHPNYKIEIEIYFSRWVEMMGGVITGTFEILKDLKNTDIQLAALSNWSRETFPLVREEFEFLDWFDPLLLSGEVGSAKPDPEIYQVFIERTGWKPETCLFIDDQPENIQEASRQGWEVHHFRSVDGLRQDLKSRGLLTIR